MVAQCDGLQLLVADVTLDKSSLVVLTAVDSLSVIVVVHFSIVPDMDLTQHIRHDLRLCHVGPQANSLKKSHHHIQGLLQ